MKIFTYSAVAAAMFALPVICCSCASSGDAAENTQETPAAAPVQGTEAKENPQPVEIKPEEPAPAPVPEAQPAPAETKHTPEAKPAPVEVKEEKKTVPPCEHTVRTGDSLWKISRQYYGSGAKWKLILDANKEKIKKADFLEPGTVLSIPAAK